MDIAERLREWPDYEPVKKFCGPEIVKDLLEAAAEIERLRAALKLILECSKEKAARETANNALARQPSLPVTSI